MDGTSKDSRFRGRLFRSLNAEDASSEYVQLVIFLSKSKSRWDRVSEVDGSVFYRVRSNSLDMKVRESDFKKCISVAKKMGEFPIFPSEPQSDINGRIRALLKVEFSNE